MLIRKFNECEEIVAGDNCRLREFLHPDKQDVDIRYSLAHARVAPGEKTWKHSLKTSEVYYITQGQGKMYINGQSSEVFEKESVYIPPFATQCIENTGSIDLEFICIVDPAWRSEDEIVQRGKPGHE